MKDWRQGEDPGVAFGGGAQIYRGLYLDEQMR